ncbi:MAG: tetratricopeptide repeat protein, partial [Candidatus Lokiarchaeota archaeon]|nr:tetratricopeptide repeat protein [Candidatus Lokiarchaeota archaeon]
MARYCTHCGKPVKEKNKFCTHCGKSMLSKIPQTENKTPDVIPEIAHERMTEKVEEITDEDGSEESIYSKSMKLTDIRIRDLFKGEKLTFLVGAGCSMDPPSCLPAGKPMMKAIINYVCADSEIEKILELEDLRFEQLVEIVRDIIDKELKIIDYYGQCDKPNLQHFFLAEMIKNGHFVMTTNFDFLIEYALQQSGVPNEVILPVITKSDYQNYSNPDDLLSKGKKSLYKIHGSTKNVVSLENTRDSLVTTIQAFGSNKEGENIFQVEPFKRPLFENISSGRSLIVLGYSGSDDFDIVPTLMVLKNLKNIVWINYIPDDGGIEKIYEINDSTLEITDNSDKVNQILSNIYRMHNADHVYRVNVNTTRLIEELIDIKPNLSSNNFFISPMTWLKNTINPPDEFEEYFIPYKIYADFGIIDDAMNCAKIILENADQKSDKKWKSIALNNIGLLLYDKGELDEALKHYREALEIDEQLGDLRGKATKLNNIGLLLKGKGELDEALKHYREALEIDEQLGDLRGKATRLNNIGFLLKGKGELDEALKHYREALEIDEQLGDLRGKATRLNNIGEIYRAQGNYPEALKRYKQALQIAEQLGILTIKAGCLNNIGEIYRAQGNYPEALKHYREALEIDEQLGDLRSKAMRLNNIGLLLKGKGELDKALKHYREALEIAEQLGDLSRKATFLNNIGTIYNAQGNYQEA